MGDEFWHGAGHEEMGVVIDNQTAQSYDPGLVATRPGIAGSRTVHGCDGMST
jgi:hypothetical protein